MMATEELAVRRLLAAAEPAARRLFACDCAERACERYEERFGEALDREAIDAGIEGVRLARGEEGDLEVYEAGLLVYASRHPAPAATIAGALAQAISQEADVWEIASVVPALCATRDDAADEWRWLRQRLDWRLASAVQTLLPPPGP